MKLILIVVSSIMASVVLQAGVLTVSNNPDYNAQYTTLQTAIDDASNGDTLLITGSSVSYGNIIINKTLSIFGSGHHPIQADTNPVEIGTIDISGVSDNCYLEGIVIRIIKPSGTAKKCTVKNCRITSYVKLNDNDNWKLIGNVFDSYITIDAETDTLLIMNNIFTYSYTILSYMNSSSLVFNNLFIQNSSSYGLLSNCSNAFFANNLFINTLASDPKDLNSGCTGCFFVNNLTYNNRNKVYADIPGSGNFGSGNLNNTDPRFVLFPTPDTQFSFDHDYHLKETSPGKGYGTDGTDIGIYGSNFNFSMNGHSALPRIEYMNILNAVLPLDSTLHIEINAVSGN